MRILIVEDEPKTGDYLHKGLRESGFNADLARTGPDGLHMALEHDYDLVVLDVMLPAMDGWTVLGKLREHKETPVLYLTARDDVADRVRGLELGADDYLVKPFAFAELLARVRTMPHASKRSLFACRKAHSWVRRCWVTPWRRAWR
jgi:two-component system, OmpR family, copper resistance phosphate regulon response regulator CusR